MHVNFWYCCIHEVFQIEKQQIRCWISVAGCTSLLHNLVVLVADTTEYSVLGRLGVYLQSTEKLPKRDLFQNRIAALAGAN